MSRNWTRRSRRQSASDRSRCCKPDRRFAVTETLAFTIRAVLIGIGATALLDLWSLVINRVFGVPSPNWGLIGRWIGHFPQGRFIHDKIATAAPINGELTIGWTAHYAIGIAFAALLVAISGAGWARQPTFLPALIFGIAT